VKSLMNLRQRRISKDMKKLIEFFKAIMNSEETAQKIIFFLLVLVLILQVSFMIWFISINYIN